MVGHPGIVTRPFAAFPPHTRCAIRPMLTREDGDLTTDLQSIVNDLWRSKTELLPHWLLGKDSNLHAFRRHINSVLRLPFRHPRKRLVGNTGLEPVTFCMSSRRAYRLR